MQGQQQQGLPFSNVPGGDMMMQMGTQYAQKAFTEGESTISKLINVGELKHYFRVNNQYVKSKLGVVMFPFHRQFLRKRCDFGDDGGKGADFYPPVDDIFAPDLYIPLMAVITYVILAAFARGTDPQIVLAGALTQVICWLTIEVLAVKLARYIFGLAHPLSMLDLLALCGYKFVGICILVLIKSLSPPLSEWELNLFIVTPTSAPMVFFLYKSLMDLCSRGEKVQKRALPIIYAISAFQVVMYLWFCSWPF